MPVFIIFNPPPAGIRLGRRMRPQSLRMEENMRFGYTLLVAGALSLGIGIQAQADNFLSHKAGNVTISLPSGWEVLPKGILKQLSQENGPEILLLAQGP